MDSSYMNDGRMNTCSACSGGQSRRMEDACRMDNRRRTEDPRRMEGRCREEESGRMENRRREETSGCMDSRRREEASRSMDNRRRMESSRVMDGERRGNESCPVGKFEPFGKTDGLVLAMAYVPWQCYQDTFDLSKGLRMGTIFPELCKPFCGKRGACQC